MTSSCWLRLPRGVAFDDAELERSFCVQQWTGSHPTAVAALSIGLMLALMLSIVYSRLREAFLIAAPLILVALVVRVRLGRTQLLETGVVQLHVGQAPRTLDPYAALESFSKLYLRLIVTFVVASHTYQLLRGNGYAGASLGEINCIAGFWAYMKFYEAYCCVLRPQRRQGYACMFVGAVIVANLGPTPSMMGRTYDVCLQTRARTAWAKQTRARSVKSHAPCPPAQTLMPLFGLSFGSAAGLLVDWSARTAYQRRREQAAMRVQLLSLAFEDPSLEASYVSNQFLRSYPVAVRAFSAMLVFNVALGAAPGMRLVAAAGPTTAITLLTRVLLHKRLHDQPMRARSIFSIMWSTLAAIYFIVAAIIQAYDGPSAMSVAAVCVLCGAMAYTKLCEAFLVIDPPQRFLNTLCVLFKILCSPPLSHWEFEVPAELGSLLLGIIMRHILDHQLRSSFVSAQSNKKLAEVERRALSAEMELARLQSLLASQGLQDTGSPSSSQRSESTDQQGACIHDAHDPLVRSVYVEERRRPLPLSDVPSPSRGAAGASPSSSGQLTPAVTPLGPFGGGEAFPTPFSTPGGAPQVLEPSTFRPFSSSAPSDVAAPPLARPPSTAMASAESNESSFDNKRKSRVTFSSEDLAAEESRRTAKASSLNALVLETVQSARGGPQGPSTAGTAVGATAEARALSAPFYAKALARGAMLFLLYLTLLPFAAPGSLASDAALTLIPALPIAPPLGRDGNFIIALVQLIYAALVHCPYLEDAVILPPGCVSMLVILSCPADLAAVIEVGGPWEGAVTWALTRTPIWWLKPRASRVSGGRRLTCSGPVS